MALFGRSKKNKAEVPAEIQEYYETSKRDRTGVAWLLAFGTLILTIVLAAGIFFAGRWTYRKIAGNDNNTSEVTQGDNQPQEEQTPETPDSTTDKQRTEEERKAEEKQKSTADSEATKEHENATRQEAEQEADSAPPQQPTGGSDNNQQIVATGDTIPATGPSDTLAIFFGVSVFGYMLHRAYATKVAKS